jgi:hypothetical protein
MNLDMSNDDTFNEDKEIADSCDRPSLCADTLGDTSVNLAFVKCDPDPQVYTMREEKYKDKVVRNCQGGWVELADEDVFAGAAREAMEEINPSCEDVSSWRDALAARLRTLYESNSPTLSVDITEKLRTWKGVRSIKSHVAIRVILQADDVLYHDILVDKDVGCDGVNGLEKTSELRWEGLSFINQSDEHFHFDINEGNLDTQVNNFEPFLRFQDHRLPDRNISCLTQGCDKVIHFTKFQQLDFKNKKYSDPKYCSDCKQQRQSNGTHHNKNNQKSMKKQRK